MKPSFRGAFVVTVVAGVDEVGPVRMGSIGMVLGRGASSGSRSGSSSSSGQTTIVPAVVPSICSLNFPGSSSPWSRHSSQKNLFPPPPVCSLVTWPSNFPFVSKLSVHCRSGSPSHIRVHGNGFSPRCATRTCFSSCCRFLNASVQGGYSVHLKRYVGV